jgi:hypothetical protein
MATINKKRRDFLASAEGQEIKRRLQYMAADSAYNTESSYSTNSSEYPDNLIPFVDKHMNYLNAHPKLDADQYLANIQLMTRVRA